MPKRQHTAFKPTRKPTYLVEGFVLHRNPTQGQPSLPCDRPRMAPDGQPCSDPEWSPRGNPTRRWSRISGATGTKSGGWDAPSQYVHSSHFLMYLLSTVLKLLLNSVP